MFFTIIGMFASLLKTNYKNASILTVFFLLVVSFFDSEYETDIIGIEFLITFVMYFLMILIGLGAFNKNKIIGIALISSLSFLPPSIFSDYQGELFPITYLMFISYLLFHFGLSMFKKWKKNAGL